MIRFLKYTFGIVIALIALLLIVPFFISLDTYKEKIYEQAKIHTGRDLTIAGKISLDLFPMPQIKLEKVSLSSIKGAKAKNLFESESLLARLEFAPLLKKNIVVSSIEVRKPIINLEKLKNNKTSWEFETIQSPESTEAETTKVTKNTSEKIPLTINNVSIQNGRLYYSDASGKTSIEDFDISISLKDLYNPSSGKLAASPASTGRWSKEKIDLSALSLANATFDFKAKKISAGQHEIGDFSITSELNNSLMKVKSFSGYILGGKFEGMASVSGKSGQNIDFKLALTNVQIRDIAPEMNRIKITSGSLDFGVNIKSHGYSQFDYVKNLKGDVHLLARDGVLNGIDLGKITSALNKPKDIASLAKALSNGIGKGETPFNSLMNDVVIEKGIVNINKCELVSGASTASSKGWVNLPEFTMDTYATVNSGIKNIPPISVHLYGPIDNMQHKIDVNAIWQYLAKNALTGVVENLKQGKIKPKDLLRGILEADRTGSADEGDGGDESSPGDAASKLLQKGLKGLFN